MNNQIDKISLDPENILDHIYPTHESLHKRDAAFSYLQQIIDSIDSTVGTFIFGSRPLKVYLPGGDIDVGVIIPSHKAAAFMDALIHRLYTLSNDKTIPLECRISNLSIINAEVKLIKCFIGDIPVDITHNTITGLCAVAFFERIARLIGRDNLFKKSILLLKTWLSNEVHLLASHQYLLSSYAVETLVFITINFFYCDMSAFYKPPSLDTINSIDQIKSHKVKELTPLTVLYRFIEIFSQFDSDKYCMTIAGPYPINIVSDDNHPSVKQIDLNKYLENPIFPSILHTPLPIINNNYSITKSLYWTCLNYPCPEIQAQTDVAPLLSFKNIQDTLFLCCTSLNSHENVAEVVSSSMQLNGDFPRLGSFNYTQSSHKASWGPKNSAKYNEEGLFLNTANFSTNTPTTSTPITVSPDALSTPLPLTHATHTHPKTTTTLTNNKERSKNQKNKNKKTDSEISVTNDDTEEQPSKRKSQHSKGQTKEETSESTHVKAELKSESIATSVTTPTTTTSSETPLTNPTASQSNSPQSNSPLLTSLTNILPDLSELNLTVQTQHQSQYPTHPDVEIPLHSSIMLPTKTSRRFNYPSSHNLWIVDPLDFTNNIGRSISMGNLPRLQTTFSQCYAKLTKLLDAVDQYNEWVDISNSQESTKKDIKPPSPYLFSIDEPITAAFALEYTNNNIINNNLPASTLAHLSILQAFFNIFYYSIKKFVQHPFLINAIHRFSPYPDALIRSLTHNHRDLMYKLVSVPTNYFSSHLNHHYYPAYNTSDLHDLTDLARLICYVNYEGYNTWHREFKKQVLVDLEELADDNTPNPYQIKSFDNTKDPTEHWAFTHEQNLQAQLILIKLLYQRATNLSNNKNIYKHDLKNESSRMSNNFSLVNNHSNPSIGQSSNSNMTIKYDKNLSEYSKKHSKKKSSKNQKAR